MNMTLRLVQIACGLFLEATVLSAGSAQKTAPPANLIANPGFETLNDGKAERWNAFDRGYSIDNTVRRSGSRSIRCANASAAEARGASWTVILNQKEPAPLLVSGWSRAEDIGGASNSDYSLYVDLIYADGTPLWGQTAQFTTGAHDWQRRQVLIIPAKPLRSATIHALFRKHAGTAWFDDIAAVELKGGRFFDSQAVAAPRLPAEAASGWFARDVATDSSVLPLTSGGSSTSLGLRLTERVGKPSSVKEAIVTDTTGKQRAVTVYYVERFPAQAAGASWWNDIRHSIPTGIAGERANLVRLGAGATGAVSLYPFGCVTGGNRGRAVGVPPLLGPRVCRIGYNAAAGLLYVAFDVALLPQNHANSDGHGHGSAKLAVVAYDVDSAWGFRSAADRFYRLFPEAYDRRAKAEGIWIPFSDPARVDRVQDFGIAYHEGDNSIASDDRLGILSFRYTEPMTWWMSMPPEMPRTYEAALEMATRLAKGNGREELKRFAQALIHSGSRDELGRFNVEFQNTPWADGALWVLNPNPRLPHGPDAATKSSISYSATVADRMYGPGAKGVQDGEYLDSIEGWAEYRDHRPESLEYSEAPPTFETESHRPVVMTWASVWEFAASMRADLHRRGKLLMANGTPWRINQFAPLLDVMGTETNWLPDGAWRPDTDAVFNLRRTLCYHKPYLLLQNTDFDKFGTEQVEKYFQRSMFYGCFPSMFSIDASSHPYWQEPRWYNRDRPLFRRYIPAIQKLSAAGWEPITHAWSDRSSVYVERFGNRMFTVLNDSAATTTVVLTVDIAPLAFGARRGLNAVDLVSGESLDVEASIGKATIRLTLAPKQARAFRLETD